MSMGFPLDSYGGFCGISMIFLRFPQEDFHDISFGFLWYFYEITMVKKNTFYFYDISRISLGILWDSHEVSWEFLWQWWFMIFLLDSCGISMVFLWYFYGITMWFLWDVDGISVMFLWDFFGIPMGFLWHSYGSSMMFLWYFYGITMGCQLKVL